MCDKLRQLFVSEHFRGVRFGRIFCLFLSCIHEPEIHSKERDDLIILIKNISLVLCHTGSYDETIRVATVTDILHKKNPEPQV